jgi:diguanylate cyclase (GGDEF)-like protein
MIFKRHTNPNCPNSEKTPMSTIDLSAFHNTSTSSQMIEEISVLNAQAWEFRLTDRNRCLELSQRALEKADLIHDRLGRGFALRGLGFCAYFSADYTAASSILSEGIEIGVELEHPQLERDCLNFLAAVSSSIGDFDAAVKHLQRSYDLNLLLNDAQGMLVNLINSGNLYARLERNEEALEVMTQALEQSRVMGDEIRESHIMTNIGSSLGTLGRADEAEPILREALKLCEKHSLNDLIASNLINLGETLRHKKHFPEALAVMAEALGLLQALGKRDDVPHCLWQKGIVQLEAGSLEEAFVTLHDALSKAQTLGLRLLESKIQNTISDAFERSKMFEKALTHFKSFYSLERTIKDENMQQRLQVLSAQHEVEKLRTESEIQRLRNVELAQALEALEVANLEKANLLESLEIQAKELEILAMRDPLTGLYNRRHLETTLETEFEHAKTSQQPLTVLMFDADDFKRINDTFSHHVGDVVLTEITDLTRANIRMSDIAARYGGEEFVVVMPQTESKTAQGVAERLRQQIESHDWERIAQGLKVTVSIGVADDLSLPDFEKLLSLADARMYQAKNDGKNKVKI